MRGLPSYPIAGGSFALATLYWKPGNTSAAADARREIWKKIVFMMRSLGEND